MNDAPLTRRAVCASLAGLGLSLATGARAAHFCSDAATSAAQAPPQAQAGAPLGEANPRILWGAHVDTESVHDAALIAALRAEKPRLLVNGSGLKFTNLHPESAEFRTWDGGSSWALCDVVVAAAARLGVPTRGDCLAWNDSLAGWIVEIAREKKTGWRAQLQETFETHVKNVFAHLAMLDRKHAMRMTPWIGVVNEPFAPWSAQGGVCAFRPGAWLDAYDPAPDGTPGYIHKAFELCARYSDPARPALFLNETYCESDRYGPLLRPAMLRLVDALQRAGRRIDAVGIEAHLTPQWMSDPARPDWRPFVAFLKELQARGVEIYITELDVNDCSLRERDARDKRVADYMGGFVTAALEIPAVRMVTNWDFSDRYTWLRDESAPTATYPTLGRSGGCVAQPACPRPNIYDQELRPKQARDALRAALAGGR